MLTLAKDQKDETVLDKQTCDPAEHASYHLANRLQCKSFYKLLPYNIQLVFTMVLYKTTLTQRQTSTCATNSVMY